MLELKKTTKWDGKLKGIRIEDGQVVNADGEIIDLIDILEKGLHNTNGHGAVQHKFPGDDGNDDLSQPCDQTDHRVHTVCIEVRSGGRFPVRLCCLRHAFNAALLIAVRLNKTS